MTKELYSKYLIIWQEFNIVIFNRQIWMLKLHVIANNVNIPWRSFLLTSKRNTHHVFYLQVTSFLTQCPSLSVIHVPLHSYPRTIFSMYFEWLLIKWSNSFIMWAQTRILKNIVKKKLWMKKPHIHVVRPLLAILGQKTSDTLHNVRLLAYNIPYISCFSRRKKWRVVILNAVHYAALRK